MKDNKEIANILKKYGFSIVNNKIIANTDVLSVYKKVKSDYILSKRKTYEKVIGRVLSILNKPYDLYNARITIKFVESKEDSILFSFLGDVFSYIPSFGAFGRRIRYFLWDIDNDRPVGLVEMSSPTYVMTDRDKYFLINNSNRENLLNYGMYVKRIITLPPYRNLRSLIISSLLTDEIRDYYYNKYKDKVTLIKKRKIEPYLLYLYTLSLLPQTYFPYFHFIGYTKGYGDLHVYHDTVKKIKKEEGIKHNFFVSSSYDIKLLTKHGIPTKHNIKKRIYGVVLSENYPNIPPLYKKNRFGTRNIYFDESGQIDFTDILRNAIIKGELPSSYALLNL